MFCSFSFKSWVLFYFLPRCCTKNVLDGWVGSRAAALIATNSGTAEHVSESAARDHSEPDTQLQLDGAASGLQIRREWVQHQARSCKSTDGPFPLSRNQTWHRSFVFPPRAHHLWVRKPSASWLVPIAEPPVLASKVSPN